MTAYRAAIIGALLVLAPALGTKADPEECRAAIDQYNTAKSEVADALRAYANCVSDSQGHDDCSSEFSTLQSDQSDFESAVSAYETDCQ